VSVIKSKGEILEVERGSLLSNLSLFSYFFYLTVFLYKEPRNGRIKKSVSLFRMKTVKI